MKNNYKKNWSESDFKQVNKAIKKHFAGKRLLNHRNETVNFPLNFNGIETILGLPYTSTSMCAMYSLDCNVNIYSSEHSTYYYNCVVLTEENEVIFIIQDNEEKEILIKG